jgi:hypothetical protein
MKKLSLKRRARFKRLATKYKVADLCRMLDVGHSIAYYWLQEKKCPGNHVGKLIDELYQREFSK